MNKFYVIANSQKDMDFAMADKISEYIIAKGEPASARNVISARKGLNIIQLMQALFPRVRNV